MIALILLLPLLSSIAAGLFSLRVSSRFAQAVTTICMAACAIMSAIVFYQIVIAGGGEVVKFPLLTWIKSGDFAADWVLRVDSLTAIMLIVVTWVSFVVHVYSIGYMSSDQHKQRFMSYLSLFTFFMLILVTSDNFLQVFVGWEGVGLCSYLLIGFWYKKDSANQAAMKAFITNRVGDFGMILGIFAIYMLFGSLSFDEVFAAVPNYTDSNFNFWGYEIHALTLIGILLFIGCMGKSAQLGLHVWLPDAMEGPTPVSALIHAATMVTAGVFLVVRCSHIYEFAPIALDVITVVGACTALFAATIGLVQNDIKKVVAYSTCSQLGYMFFACGVSAYSAAIFHLMTHAFFKALLFLGAGSVIHAMSNEQDMRNMGGIWKKIPITYGFMWIGSLALAGIPPFAGFYSKDLIIESAYAAGSEVGKFAFWMGIIAAFLTAFYSWRLLFMTFHGKPRASADVMSHIHESPKIMNLPLIILLVGAIASGFVGSVILHMTEFQGDFWGRAIFNLDSNNAVELAHYVPSWVIALPIICAISGIFFAWVFYLKAPGTPAKIAKGLKPLYILFKEKWFFDKIYHALFVRSAFNFGKFCWNWIDINIIDNLGPNGFARIVSKGADASSNLQTGYVFHYALFIVGGMVLFLGLLYFSY